MRHLLILCVTLSLNAFGHGEDKPGPNGGFIQMPGAYHTELVVDGNRLKLFLLDVDFKNPVTKHSSVKVALKQNGKKTELSCKPEENYFSCQLPKDTKLDNGSILVNAVRYEVTGGVAKYQLPLSHSVEHHGH